MKPCILRTINKGSKYPSFTIGSRKDGSRKRVSAHRYILEKKLGRAILPGMQALHKCNNRACIEEDHLYEGSPLDNVHDSIRVGSHMTFGRTTQDRKKSDRTGNQNRSLSKQ